MAFVSKLISRQKVERVKSGSSASAQNSEKIKRGNQLLSLFHLLKNKQKFCKVIRCYKMVSQILSGSGPILSSHLFHQSLCRLAPRVVHKHVGNIFAKIDFAV